MYRRRARRPRDIAFSLDSFLDVIANVVGIIIRLILVAWVGARAYQALRSLPDSEAPGRELTALAPISDPLEQVVAARQRELGGARQQLAGARQRLTAARTETAAEKAKLTALEPLRRQLEDERADAERSMPGQGVAVTAQSLEELRRRRERLEEEIRALKALPPAKKQLRYRTPVSRPVGGEEIFFECQAGRVSFIDIAALVAELRGTLREKEEALRSRWQVDEVTSAVGDFRLRYTVERVRGYLDSVSGGPPAEGGNFRYGVHGWLVEPLNGRRGEALEAALAGGSAFRAVTDGLHADYAAVTFWVYPDSFELFRRLRDYLYERGIEVAGRPLPPGHPIGSAPDGTRSRGQ